MVNVICEDRQTELPGGVGSGDALWLSAADAERATGWTLKPEGLCQGDVCVPVPPARRADFVGERGVNVGAFWRHMGRPAVHDDVGDVWLLGASARDRAAKLESLEAPDFALPDANGRLHTLSEHRGKKVLLVTWASW